MCCLSFRENKWVVILLTSVPTPVKIPRYVIVWRELAIWLLTYNLWKTGVAQKKVRMGGCFPSCLNVLHVHSKHTKSTIVALEKYWQNFYLYWEGVNQLLSLCSQFIQWSKKIPYQIVVIKTIDFPAFIYCGSRRVNSNHVIYI